MITELRRRAYLSAMQVASWLPRVELPFAAPSRPELLEALVEPEAEVPLPLAEQVVEQRGGGSRAGISAAGSRSADCPDKN